MQENYSQFEQRKHGITKLALMPATQRRKHAFNF